MSWKLKNKPPNQAAKMEAVRAQKLLQNRCLCLSLVQGQKEDNLQEIRQIEIRLSSMTFPDGKMTSLASKVALT